MNVLVIGGTRFLGYQLVWRLLNAGHAVTLLNRGTHPDPFGDRVRRLRADRTTPQFAEVLAGQEFDATVDFAAYNASDARGVVEVLGGRTGHYIVISTGGVYTVLQDCPKPTTERDYASPILPRPEDPADLPSWTYGTEKREMEDVLAAAWAGDRFPYTALRLPIVLGERDYSRRLEEYMWRVLDGGPVLLPDGGSLHVRHLYSEVLARTIVDMLGNPVSFGQAYNLAQDEIPTLAQLVIMLAELMGAPARIVPVSEEELRQAGLSVRGVSALSSRWNSLLDPCKAKLDLGFQHEPLREYLGRIVAAFIAYLPEEPPAGYAQRAREVELAREVAE